ncbi:hypothetical protein E8E13_002389 [Curvularia kusanoi]|uniref:Uncharacterized protein n=1 Tax=Curvularia kusanoi TaxID=90978 RepID=A0A9P4T6E0_CURKU|nr:hypothetical protein E8E13_002389 [Curvularia kusanoi]
MNAEYSMWDSWPLGNGPPVHHYPPAPTCTDYGDDESSLPTPFDLVTTAGDTQYAANILAAFKARQRSAPTRKDFQNTNDHSRVVENQEDAHNLTHHGNLEEGLGKRHSRGNQRKRNNDLRPPMGKGGFHIPGAFPNDLLRDAEVSYPVLSISEAQRERKQPTVEDAKDDVKPHQPALTPLNPDFLIPSKPPSPILPKATEPNNTLGPTEIRSMWHNYYTSLDRASETRYIKALRRAGYTVTKRSARGILRHKKESRRRKAASNM